MDKELYGQMDRRDTWHGRLGPGDKKQHNNDYTITPPPPPPRHPFSLVFDRVMVMFTNFVKKKN